MHTEETEMKQEPIEARFLSKRERIRLKITGRVYIGDRKHDGWKKALPHYLVHCARHGLYLSYPQGWHDRLDCPECSRTVTQR